MICQPNLPAIVMCQMHDRKREGWEKKGEAMCETERVGNGVRREELMIDECN